MFRTAAWVGVAMTLIGAWIAQVFPSEIGPLPAGMRTPIVAFELARSWHEVENMFGWYGDYERQMYVRAMDSGNRQDFVFLVAYGLFFVTFTRALGRTAGTGIRFRSWLVTLPSVMDALENWQLLAITAALRGDYYDALARLAWFTWLKWFGISLVLMSWVPALWKLGNLGRLTACAAGFTAVITVVAFFTRGAAAELMALGVATTLLSALTLSIWNSRSA